LEEECKRRGLPNEDADGNDQSYLKNLKSRTGEELAMLQENGSMKNLAEELGCGIKNDGLRRSKLALQKCKSLITIKSKTVNELLGLQGVSKKDLIEKFSGGMDSSSSLKQVKSRTSEELATLVVKSDSKKDLMERYSHGMESGNVDKIRSKTASELSRGG
jgi:restriction endonuclease